MVNWVVPRAYSVDLRERVLRAQAAGLSAAEIERALGISRRTLARWRQRLAHNGSLAPGRSPGRPPKVPADQTDALRAQVAAAPDATLAEHCARWAAARGVRVSPAALSRLLAKLGLPLKKSR